MSKLKHSKPLEIPINYHLGHKAVQGLIGNKEPRSLCALVFIRHVSRICFICVGSESPDAVTVLRLSRSLVFSPACCPLRITVAPVLNSDAGAGVSNWVRFRGFGHSSTFVRLFFMKNTMVLSTQPVFIMNSLPGVALISL